ncbi:hypothetical protein HDE_01875 [Halotydeus destructor]|nr:hypothetical protein HDE_01875 [Halotydeus destructor]
MATYASPKALKWILLTVNSVNFIIGTFIIAQGLVMVVGVNKMAAEQDDSPMAAVEVEDSDPWGVSSETAKGQDIPFGHDRFPSVGSPAGVLLFGLLIAFVGALGTLAANKEDVGLVNTYSYSSVISCFVKLLLVLATIVMHTRNSKYDPISRLPVLLGLVICTFELVLGMCGCQYAKILKRGDAARPKIEPLPEKV